MRLTDSPLLSVIIIVAVIILLLVVLWLINESRKKKYYEDAIRYVLAPERAPVGLTWLMISAPDPQGFMTSSAAATLDGLSDQVLLTLKSKNQSRMQQFIDNVKFRFSPIYTPPPEDIFQSLLKAIGLRSSLVRKRSTDMSHLSKASVSAASGDITLDDHDLLLEFGMQGRSVIEPKTGESGGKSVDTEKTYYAVAFNIDPTITRYHALNTCPSPITCTCNGKDYYYTYQPNITETVYVSGGSVDALLGSSMPVVNAGQEITQSLYNPGGSLQYSSIGGRNLGSNSYRLTGTWTAW